ncbi:MAG: SGNH/GDSL hydrolase family protein, partial [Microbacterium sp.]
PDGAYRGWADRLATLLAQTSRGEFRYANLAVRSRRMRDLVRDQAPRALSMRPDLVAILMGSNDLVHHGASPLVLGEQLEAVVREIRATGADVLLVTPFLPHRHSSLVFAKRFAAFSHEVRRIARETGSLLLDVEALPELGVPDMWAEDRVHLRSRGHRLLSYRAAEVLGLPFAHALGDLDDALHVDDDEPGSGWVHKHLLPYVARRLRGRTAGDGLAPKHDSGYVVLPPPASANLSSL